MKTPILRQISDDKRLGADFPARNRTAFLCSDSCHRAWSKVKHRKAPRLMKPHVFDHYITIRVDPPRLTPGKADWLFMMMGRAIVGEAEMPRATAPLFQA